jgi:hypothetical protein
MTVESRFLKTRLATYQGTADGTEVWKNAKRRQLNFKMRLTEGEDLFENGDLYIRR